MNDHYLEFARFVKHVKVVNDSSERAIKLVQELIDKAHTKKNWTLCNIVVYFVFKNTFFTKYLTSNYLKTKFYFTSISSLLIIRFQFFEGLDR